jgi:hypothetical protein
MRFTSMVAANLPMSALGMRAVVNDGSMIEVVRHVG